MSKAMNVYLTVAASVLTLIPIYVVFVPMMISSASTLWFICGLLIAFVLGPMIAYSLYKAIVSSIDSYTKSNKETENANS